MRWIWWVIGTVGLCIIGGTVWYLTDILPERAAREIADGTTPPSSSLTEIERSPSLTTSPTAAVVSTNVTWEFIGETWTASSPPPVCPDPLQLVSPVALAQVTSILYPGQIRTGDYKPHGGFRFVDGTNATVTVTVPLDARLTRASRYIEQGEVQYLMEFVHPCGIAYRFDHLLTLAPKFQAVVDTLPPAQVDDSRTTTVDQTISAASGETLATTVGFAVSGNTSVDFGVYDLRMKNQSAADPNFRREHRDESELAYYGVCWFDLLSESDAELVRTLPAGDTTSGETSDYCK